MSHIHQGPLATYNSLTDGNLSGYFGNTRMRRHLRKSGLINRRGEIVSENQYRVNMARKEHKKHVKELLAQAIVHKTLDLERYRQVEIKRKLEEIAKIELVRRVRAGKKNRQDACLMPLLAPKPPKKLRSIDRSVVPRNISQNLLDLERFEMKDNLRPASIMKDTTTRGRKGDEEVLPYLTPRSMSRPQSERPSESSSVHRRPKSAPAPPRNRPSSTSRGFVDPYEDVIYVDDDGRPVSPPPSDRASSKDLKTEGIDSRHLYALDSEALQQYAMKLSRSESGRDGASSPYLISQYPVPPKAERAKSARSPRRSARMSARPEGPQKERKAGVRQSNDHLPNSSRRDPDTVEGALMLHRQEPAMMHQGEVQTLCEITMKYHGPNLTLPRDQHDPTQEVSIEQQHCGGNTLPVFRERLQAGKTFSFISRRHRGYPFSLTLYIDGRVDCRISTCCEYKHMVGVRLGGKMGHFSLTGITGATPCYKCKLSCQAPPRSLKLKKSMAKKKKTRSPSPQEEVTVDNTPRTPIVSSKKEEQDVNGKSDEEENQGSDRNVVIPVEDDLDQSRTENSHKGKPVKKDKFTPQNPGDAKTGLSPLKDSLDVKESKVEVEAGSDPDDDYKDDFEDDKEEEKISAGEDNKNKDVADKTAEDSDRMVVNGYDQTEIVTDKQSKNDTYSEKSKKPVESNQDTDYEIEEDIFNEQTERSKVTAEPAGNLGDNVEQTIAESIDEEIHTDLDEDKSLGVTPPDVSHAETNPVESVEEDIQTRGMHPVSVNKDGLDYGKKNDEADDANIPDAIDEVRKENDEANIPDVIGTIKEEDIPDKRDTFKEKNEANILDSIDEVDIVKEADSVKDADAGIHSESDKNDTLNGSLENGDNKNGKGVKNGDVTESVKNTKEKDNYEDDFEDEVGVPIPIDIKSARDIEILNQVNVMGKRVVLETSEGTSENISAMIEYSDDSDVVLVKRYRPIEGVNVEGILMDTLEMPGIAEALREEEEEEEEGEGEKEDLFNLDKDPPNVKSNKSKKGKRVARSVSSASSMSSGYSAHSRSRDSSSSRTVTHSAPEYLESFSNDDNLYRHSYRPKSAWGHSSTTQVRPVKKLRPVSSRKEVPKKEKYDVEYLRAKFYPPPHNCLDKPAIGSRYPSQRKRPEKQRAEAVQFRRRNRVDDNDVSFESPPNTLAKTENFIDTVLASMPDISPSGGGSPRLDMETADEVSDIEPDFPIQHDYPVHPATHPLEVNININKKKKKAKPKAKPAQPAPKVRSTLPNTSVQSVPQVKSQSPTSKVNIVETPGVSVAYAKHVLKRKDSASKEVKDRVNINIQAPLKPRARSPSPKRRASSPKRARSPSPKRSAKLDLTGAKKEIDVKVDDGKAEIEKLLQESLDIFGLKLQEQQRQFAEQLQLAHDQFAAQLSEAQAALSNHGDTIKGDLSSQLKEATETVTEQVQESQSTLNQQLEMSQKTLVEQLTESQTIMSQQFKESQTTFGELVSDAQTVMADQLKDSQKIFGEQVQDSQKLLSEQLNESQKTLTNQMKDTQDVITNQLKDSQHAIADQVKESQEVIADQLKQSQETIADQLKTSQTTFAAQLMEAQTALSTQLTESQGHLSDQVSTAQLTIADDLTNAQTTIAKQVEENQKVLSDQLITSQEKIDTQLHETQAKISDQLVDTKKEIDDHLLVTLETIGKQENDARERLQKDSEETHKSIMMQEESAKVRLQQESEESQKRLAEQEEATREKLQKEAEDTREQFQKEAGETRDKLQQEADDTREQLQKEAGETREQFQKEATESRQVLQSQVDQNRDLLQKEATENLELIQKEAGEAQDKLQKETEDAQKRFAEQEALAKEEMEKEREETQKRLEEQEKNAREQLLKEGVETQRRLAEQEAQAKQQLQKESEETQKRLAEQEQKAKEEMKKESEETAKKLAAQEALAMEAMKKESEETAQRLKEQEEQAREELKKDSEESAKKFAEQEQNAREQLKKESEETQKRLADQEEQTKAALKKESEETAKRLADQEAAARVALLKEGQESAKRLADQEKKAREEFQKESSETAKRLAEQEAHAKAGLKDELDQSKSQISDAMKAMEPVQKAIEPVQKASTPRKPRDKYEDDFEPEVEDRRQIIGLQADEVRENGVTVKVDVKEKEEEEAKEGTLPDHRRIEGYSSEDEDLQGGREPLKVSADVNETKKQERRRSTSSSSSSSSESSRSRSRSTTPMPAKILTAKTVSPVKGEAPLRSDRTDITERSTTSTTSGSLTTATESTLEPRPPSAPKPQRRRGSKTSSSSSSSSSSSDTEDEKYKRKKRDKRLKEEAEKMKREMEAKEMERKKRMEEDALRKKKEDDERRRRLEEEEGRRNEERMRKEEERKQREDELFKKKEEQDEKKKAELVRRQSEEERMQAAYEKQLQLIKLQRESEDNLLSSSRDQKSVIEMESTNGYSVASNKSYTVESTLSKQVVVGGTSSSDTESTTTGASSTTTESEPDKDKQTVTPMTTISEEKVKQKSSSSSSSSSSSAPSSSSSEDETEKEVKTPQVPEPTKTKPAPVVMEQQQSQAVIETSTTVVEQKVEVKEDQDKTPVPPPQKKESSTEDSSSSSSGSSSETESEEDNNKRVTSPKPIVVQTSTVVTKTEQEPPKSPTVAEAPAPVQQAGSKTADKPLESETSETTGTDSTPRPVLVGGTVDSNIPPQSVTTETKEETPKKEESEDSSSDSSSSSDDSSSDSESETEPETEKKTATSQGGRASESDGENMHGGNDPENVAGAGTRPESRLAQSSVKPPVSVDGSILPLIKDESSVEFNGVKLDDDQVTQLCNYIAEKDEIRALTVRNAGLDDMAFQNVALSLQVTLSYPKLLNFSQNKLGGKAMTNLSPAIKKNTELSILILNGNPIGNVGCKVIVDAILKAKDPFPFLRRSSGYLTPSQSRAMEAEGKTVTQEEPENLCAVTELDLGDTNISDAGIMEISRLLENNKTVVSLNLNGNKDVSAKGWERLAQALRKNGTLKTLSLDFTNIGDEGLEKLVKGLRENTGLRALELESAGLSEKGGLLLRDLLKSNTSLIELSCTTGNNIPDGTLDEIRKYLALNNSSARH